MEAEGASPGTSGKWHDSGIPIQPAKGQVAEFYILAYDEIPTDKNIRVVTTIGKQMS